MMGLTLAEGSITTVAEVVATLLPLVAVSVNGTKVVVEG